MKSSANRENKFVKSVLGMGLTAACGLVLWFAPLGEPWVNASYDYLFRFGSRSVTNNVVVILMDNEAYDQFNQVRGQIWDRKLHAQMLRRLAADRCALVVFGSFFRNPSDPTTDQVLADAIRQQRRVVLMAEQASVTHPGLVGVQPTLPLDPILRAAGTNWGVAWLDPDLDSIVRRHWPFPDPGPYPSLPWIAARLSGAQLDRRPQERWLRYYGRSAAWTQMSYCFALTQPTNYYRDKVVFIGNEPKASVMDGEPDQFLVPYSRWTGEAVGGVEVMITSFLNLMNGDWLRRADWWIESLAVIITGVLLGGILCQLRPRTACATAVAIAAAVSLGAVSWSFFTNYWFPWLVIAGGQMPCALAWALVAPYILRTTEASRQVQAISKSRGKRGDRGMQAGLVQGLPDAPDYELVDPPFGKGSYGKVWVARNAIGQWQALKVIYLANFNENADPYEREFNGIKRYKPLSDKHPGLLRIDFISRKRGGYFYYVMELGDSLDPNWEHEPSTYKPRDLGRERARAPGHRLPVRDCMQIGLELTEALEFLHRHGLTHRDIKPQNIIFIDGHPKLADVGLISEIRPTDPERTLVGTPGYMPPPPERPGTPQADIYALGMVLYVLSTGHNSALFPEISTTLVANNYMDDFLPLNSVILKACQPDCTDRFSSAAEMHRALEIAQKALEGR